MMSSMLPSALGSMMSTMGNTQQGIPMLLGGAAQNVPDLGGGGLVPSAVTSTMQGDLKGALIPSELSQGMQSAMAPVTSLMKGDMGGSLQPPMPPGQGGGGGGGLADLLQGQLGPGPGMKAPAGLMGAPMAGPQTPAGPSFLSGLIPSPSAMNQALANTALVQKMGMQARPQPATAPAPHMFIPQGGKPPTFGAPVARGASPLERFALMLRR
jgi:hypothetical protein